MKLQLLKGWFSLWQESEGEDQAAGGCWRVTCAAAAWFLCKNIANFAPVPRTSLKMSRSSNNPAPAHNSTTLRFPTLILNYSSKQIRFGKLWFSDYQYIHFSNSAPSLQNSFGSGFGLQGPAEQQQCSGCWWRWSPCLSLSLKSCTGLVSPRTGDCLHRLASSSKTLAALLARTSPAQPRQGQ